MAARRGAQGGRGAPHRQGPPRSDPAHRRALRILGARRRGVRPRRDDGRRDLPVGFPAGRAPAGRAARARRRRAQAGIPDHPQSPDLLLRGAAPQREPPPRRAGHPLRREPHRPRAVGAGAAAPDPVRRAHRRAEPGHDARGAPQRDASLEPDGGVGASAPGRPGRPAAALVRSRAVRSPGLRGAGPRPKPGPGAGGDRRGGAPPPPGRGGVDRGAAHPVRASPARGAPARRGLEPGAGEPRATRAHDRPADARERRGHRDGAHHAGVRRRLGRPRAAATPTARWSTSAAWCACRRTRPATR